MSKDTLGQEMVIAFKPATQEAIDSHWRAGRTVVGMQDGKVIWAPPPASFAILPPPSPEALQIASQPLYPTRKKSFFKKLLDIFQ